MDGLIMQIVPSIILCGIAVLLLAGILSSKVSSRFNVPILLMFLIVGMIAGADGLGIQFNNYEMANWVGTVAMIFILYSGGIDTRFHAIRPVLGTGAILATLGVFITAIVLALGAYFILDWPRNWCLLLGAVVSSTDAAAVFGILAGRQVGLKGRLRPLLEFESGSNDPMAAFMTIFVIGLVNSDKVLLGWNEGAYFLINLILKMGIGCLCGYLLGRLGALMFNKLKLEYEGLYFVMGIAIALLSYSAVELCYGNGFLGAYVCGITMGNLRYRFKKGLTRFGDGISWFMQVVMFMSLGLLVSPHMFLKTLNNQSIQPFFGNLNNWGDIFGLLSSTVAFKALLLALVLMFVARPAAVMISMLGSKFSYRERLLCSWVGLRGAAPIVLATFPLVMVSQINPHYEYTGQVFNIVFFVVILSVLFQGLTLMPFARLLKLDSPTDGKERMPLELEETGVMNSVMHEFELGQKSAWVNQTLAQIQLPSEILVMLIRRNNRFIMARGNTHLQAGDGMLLMGDRVTLAAVAKEHFPECDYFID